MYSAGPQPDTIRIVLVDRQLLVRQGLRLLINSWPGMQLAGEAGDTDEAIELVRQIRPDLVLASLELQQEHELNVLERMVATARPGRVLLITTLRNRELHPHAVSRGVMGLVLKEQPAELLAQAIRTVHAGEAWLDRATMARVLMGRCQQQQSSDAPARQIAHLTPRERDVVELMAHGLQNRHIGSCLSISETTVRHHLTSIFGKLGVSNRLELMLYAYRHGLASIPAR